MSALASSLRRPGAHTVRGQFSLFTLAVSGSCLISRCTHRAYAAFQLFEKNLTLVPIHHEQVLGGYGKRKLTDRAQCPLCAQQRTRRYPDSCSSHVTKVISSQKPAARMSAAENRLGRGEISPGCCYDDPGNVDWSRWMPSHPPLLTVSSFEEDPNAGRRYESRQRGRPW